MSTRISAFLQVFTGIFGTRVCGLRRGRSTRPPGPLAGSAGRLWPALQPSRSRWPCSAILVWAASHLPVIRSITRIADLYFDTPRGRDGADLALRHAADAREPPRHDRAGVAGSDQPGAGRHLCAPSFFNRDWFNAIQEKNAEQFWTLLFTVFLFWAAIYIVSAILEYVIQSGLTIRWRQWLTDNYVSEWLGERHALPHGAVRRCRRQPGPAYRRRHRPLHRPPTASRSACSRP